LPFTICIGNEKSFAELSKDLCEISISRIQVCLIQHQGPASAAQRNTNTYISQKEPSKKYNAARKRTLCSQICFSQHNITKRERASLPAIRQSFSRIILFCIRQSMKSSQPAVSLRGVAPLILRKRRVPLKNTTAICVPAVLIQYIPTTTPYTCPELCAYLHRE
jgi:hypothetical protein